MKDDGVANVVGAILVLALVGISILVVDSVYVPKQGATLEVTARERAESSLIAVASQMGSSSSPVIADVPLSPERDSPSLLPGIILDPARAEGRATFDASRTNASISVVVPAPAGGVPTGDPTRVDLGGGLMRLYALGNATSGAPLGTLSLDVGGAYLDAARYQVAGGAVVLSRGGASSAIAPPGLLVTHATGADRTRVAWRIPVLGGGDQQVSGQGDAQLRLVPGPVAAMGGGDLVRNVTIRIDTDAVGAWRAALTDIVGANGFVNATRVGAPDNGTVVATLLPPPGTPNGTSAVAIDLSLVRFEVSVAARAAS